VLQVRVVTPRDRRQEVDDLLGAEPAVCNIVVLDGAARRPSGDVVIFDVAREAANQVVDGLRNLNLHIDGSITIDPISTSLSVAAQNAEFAAPGAPSEAVVWEEVEARVRHDASLSGSFLTLMVLAVLIAAVGIVTDSPILIVGAMVVSPEFGPVSGMMLAILKRRRDRFMASFGALVAGMATAIAVAFAFGICLKIFDRMPLSYLRGERPLTTFISRPDLFTVIVAVCAAVAGAVSLTEARAGALVGVFISVTTIPAAADIGVATATTRWSEAGGSALQLLVNVTALVLVGAAVLHVKFRLWPVRRRRRAMMREPSPR
jgi:uncharacterized hydrophobic protein (TIGR00271 family)